MSDDRRINVHRKTDFLKLFTYNFMGISNLLLQEMQEMNQNLRAIINQNPLVINKKEWVTLKEAEQMLNRKRTWINSRKITNLEDAAAVNTNFYLIKGLDWKHDGKLLIFKRQSIERLRDAMQAV